MQEQFFTQFVESFKQVFIQNIDSLFLLFSKYATALFFSLATIEILIVGLLIALSSSTSIYSLLLKIIKISVFFFLISHFNKFVQLIFDSIKYISLQTLSHVDTSSLFSNHQKISDLWNFNNPNNYVTEGLVNGMDSVADYSDDNSSDQTNPQANPDNNSDNGQNEQTQKNSNSFSFNTLLGFGQFFTLALTATLALGNIILFYLSALIALLMCPFGQISLTANFFHNAFSKFLSSGLRLLSFIIIFMLFNLLYNHIAHALPDLLLPGGDSSSYGYIDMSSDSNGDNQESNLQLTSIIDFMMSLLGLFICWFIPKEISQKVGVFVIPSLPAETSTSVAVTQGGGNVLPSAAAGVQMYSNQQSSAGATMMGSPATTSIASHSGISSGTPAVTVSASVSAQVNAAGKTNQLSGHRAGKSAGHKNNQALHKQTSFLRQNFSQERASKLRQNFHNAMEKSEK